MPPRRVFCPVNECQKGFASNGNVKRHLEKTHGILRTPPQPENAFPCISDGCNRAFKTKRTRTVHLKNIHDLFVCVHCHQIVTGRAIFHQHKLEHITRRLAERSFLCEICGKTYKSNGVLSRHRNQVHEEIYPY